MRLAGWHVQVRRLGQQVLLETADRRRWIHPQLLDQMGPQGAQRLQRVRLPVAAVERDREQRPEPFPERVLPDEGCQHRLRLVVSAQVEEGLTASLHETQSVALEPGDLGVEHLDVREVGVRPAPPEAERGRGQPLDLPGVTGRGVPGGGAEGPSVDVRADQRIAGLAAQEHGGRVAAAAAGLEERPQSGDRDLEGSRRRRRRLLAPHLVDEAVGAHLRAGRRGQQRQHDPFTATAQALLDAVHAHPQRAQHLHLDRSHAGLPSPRKA